MPGATAKQIVQDRRGPGIVARGEHAQRRDFVHDRVLRRLPQGLLIELQGTRVVALLEGRQGLVEELVGCGRLRRFRGGIERQPAVGRMAASSSPAVIVVDDYRLRVVIDRRGGGDIVRVGVGVAVVIAPPGQQGVQAPGRCAGNHRGIPVVAPVSAPTTVIPAVIVRGNVVAVPMVVPIAVPGVAQPPAGTIMLTLLLPMLTKLLLPPGRLTMLFPPPMIGRLPMGAIPAADDRPVADAGDRQCPVADPGRLADAGPVADIRPVARSGRLPMPGRSPPGRWQRRGTSRDTGLRDRGTAHISETGPIFR